eukprot:CAMPEP_0173056348 /NCGR_PEP_ID=MMETSP1102-20130122/80_1 /TAXON_ID=49646 /ORGANISM="Geminigera sp., Strain Caron Lab Isolate" /LENGTH=125 /DNA_ID=CAMNT_0013921633 /DNA_START=2115 /DNA_END=2492 /DNA_ORIENTATION=+
MTSSPLFSSVRRCACDVFGTPQSAKSALLPQDNDPSSYKLPALAVRAGASNDPHAHAITQSMRPRRYFPAAFLFSRLPCAAVSESTRTQPTVHSPETAHVVIDAKETIAERVAALEFRANQRMSM